MANSKAFTFEIKPEGSGAGENNLVHQTSPAWVLTFIRWEIRDTLRTQNTTEIDSETIREPLVVENDCLSVSTSGNKGVFTPSMAATLVQTDVNYETAIAPGDFVFVNILNWNQDARSVANNARLLNPINGPDDGFKGVYKVQSVRKILAANPDTGTVTLLFKITGYAFTEFSNKIYFNPYLIDPNNEATNLLLFSSNIGNNFSLMASLKGITNIQDIIKMLIESFIGTGIGESGGRDKNGTVRTPNTQFFIPQAVGQLLGVPEATAAKDIFNYLFGIQSYAGGSAVTSDTSDLALGANPTKFTLVSGRFYFGPKCQGEVLKKPEYWDQIQTWSILNQFSNSPLNELFTCFRVSPSGSVMPTVVFRQIPFTTEDFDSSPAQAAPSVGAINTPVTRFMNLPRWKLSPAMVTDLDIGREEAARINFVQYFGRSTLGKEGQSISNEIAEHNYLYDIDDVGRSGLRPYVINTCFDEPTANKPYYMAKTWARIVGDAVMGNHLKLNGTFTSAGIVDPIAVGDNLEFDGVVYHIEQINHTASIGPADGKKRFRTTISVSMGLSVDSDSQGTAYAEMAYPNAYKLRDVDAANNHILPGVSESQDVIYRPANPEWSGNKDNVPFEQPDVSTSVNRSTRDEEDKK